MLNPRFRLRRTQKSTRVTRRASRRAAARIRATVRPRSRSACTLSLYMYPSQASSTRKGSALSLNSHMHRSRTVSFKQRRCTNSTLEHTWCLLHSLRSTLVLSSLPVANRCRCNLSSASLLHMPMSRRRWRFMRRTPTRSPESLSLSLGIRPPSTCSHSSTRAVSVAASSHSTAVSSPKQRRLCESLSRRRTRSLCTAAATRALITLQVHRTTALSRRRARLQPTDGSICCSRQARLRDRWVSADRRQRSAACATTRRAAAAGATRRRSRSSCSARSSCSTRTTTRSRAAFNARTCSSELCASRSCNRWCRSLDALWGMSCLINEKWWIDRSFDQFSSRRLVFLTILVQFSQYTLNVLV